MADGNNRLYALILSLDNGGVLGSSSFHILPSLIIMGELMARLAGHRGQKTAHPWYCFGLIAGIGTGALFALFLGPMRMSVNQAIEGYTRVAVVVAAAVAFQPQPTPAPSVLHPPEVVPFDGVALFSFGSTVERSTSDHYARITEQPDVRQCRTATLEDAQVPPFVFQSHADGARGGDSICDEARATSAALGDPLSAGAADYNNPSAMALRAAERVLPGRPVACINEISRHMIEYGHALQVASFESREEPFSRRSQLCLDGKIHNQSKYPVEYGGYSDIWTGSSQNYTVAIKIMRSFDATGSRIETTKLLKRLWREYTAWSKLSHPNVLSCLGFSYDFTPQSGHTIPSLISRWMSNGTVLSYIRACPGVDRFEMVLGIARGLEYLHGRNPAIVHGDLRAGNVLVSDAGVPCLTDFGLSRIISETRGMTMSSEVGGSLRWMAPELFDKGKLCFESDVWAFGMTVLEIFTGKRPFDDLSLDAQVMLRTMHGHLPARPVHAIAPGLTDKIWMVCQKCWSLQPAHRPCMRDVLTDITSGNMIEW